MSEIEDRWLSVDERCKYIGVSNDTVIGKHGMPVIAWSRKQPPRRFLPSGGE